MVQWLRGLFAGGRDRDPRRYQPSVDKVNSLEVAYQALDDEALRNKTLEFRRRLGVPVDALGFVIHDPHGNIAPLGPSAGHESLDDILPEAFAAVREAARRALGMRHYDVQITGGIALHRGHIAEMRTGEGKTLVASLPLYLNALTGRGCHLITPNDYLSRVGGGWMGPVNARLGITTGVICHEFAGVFNPDYVDPTPRGDERLAHWQPVARRDAYRADITYGTNHEFGFDYLRDNMVYDLSQMVQRDLAYAIVDEVDNILIDEARTPLIISGPADEPPDTYGRFARIVERLRAEDHYTVDLKAKAVMMTDEGIDRVEQLAGVQNIYGEENYTLVHYLEQALRAHVTFRRDRDYVLVHEGRVLGPGEHRRDAEIVIVDEFTGRLMPGRRYSEGLHQAIEAKEGVAIRRENLTLATITFQNYFRLYGKLSGMTGTAMTEADEFRKIYNLEVVQIPTHRPMVRDDMADLIFRSGAGKIGAIVDEIEEMHASGRPVLVGTTSVEKSESLSRHLRDRGINHQVLNAKYHEMEATIVAQAGRLGAVTIATNMAGRGTDIILGAEDTVERETVRELGGLHIIGTERHESRRIDNQLRGRAGRQGDPGSSRFYLSLEDDLMRRFGSERIMGIMDRLGLDDDQPIEHPMVSRSIEQAQEKVEGFNFDMRKHTVEYDDVMNTQRAVVYRQRRQVLHAEAPRNLLISMARALADRVVQQHTESSRPDDWNLEAVYHSYASLLGPDLAEAVPDADASDILAGENRETMPERLVSWAEAVYDLRERRYSPELFAYAVKGTTLRVIDGLWQEHLTAIDDMIAGIGLRAYGQRDPLTEYKGEAYRLFQDLVRDIQANVIGACFRMQFALAPEAPLVRGAVQADGVQVSVGDGDGDHSVGHEASATVTGEQTSLASDASRAPSPAFARRVAQLVAPPRSMAHIVTNQPVEASVPSRGPAPRVSAVATGADGRPLTRAERNRQEALERRARNRERRRGT
jgi:preprotein translocase subunit SecA